jgi:serine O-acetyltransferase
MTRAKPRLAPIPSASAVQPGFAERRLHVAASAPVPPQTQAADIEHIWRQISDAAAAVAQREPLLRHRLQPLLSTDRSPAAMLAAVLAGRLACDDLPRVALQSLMQTLFDENAQVLGQVGTDLAAVKERDPACPDYLHVLLNLKGFQALQAYRAAHLLWRAGRRELAFALAGQASLVFAVDIHPAAQIGAGVMLDHGTGIVIGETTVIEDDVSILQNVTLGGTGKQHGDRHPKIRRGVLIGAGATILGNIEVGTMSKVAAGSVVLKLVPPHCTVAGVPARIVREHQDNSCPSTDMDQTI